MYRTSIIWFFLFNVLWSKVGANTEIKNFEVTDELEIAISQTSKWPTLYPGNNEVEWGLELASTDTTISRGCQLSGDPPIWPTSCSSEKFVILDLDHNEWRDYSRFTLRISWPASTPAGFFVHIHSPESLLTWLSQSQYNSTLNPANVEHAYIPSQKSRRKYAYIRVVDETDTQPASSLLRKRVAFRIILEPLIMGVLPASMLPTVLVLFLVVSIAILAVPRINGYLEGVAEKVREVGQAHTSNVKKE